MGQREESSCWPRREAWKQDDFTARGRASNAESQRGARLRSGRRGLRASAPRPRGPDTCVLAPRHRFSFAATRKSHALPRGKQNLPARGGGLRRAGTPSLSLSAPVRWASALLLEAAQALTPCGLAQEEVT